MLDLRIWIIEHFWVRTPVRLTLMTFIYLYTNCTLYIHKLSPHYVSQASDLPPPPPFLDSRDLLCNFFSLHLSNFQIMQNRFFILQVTTNMHILTFILLHMWCCLNRFFLLHPYPKKVFIFSLPIRIHKMCF